MKRINISIKCYYIMITNAIYTEPMGTKENPYPITPPVKDRERSKYYIYKNEVRYWNGRHLIDKEKEKKQKKEYRKKNKEKIKKQKKEYRKKYYEKHKEEINKKNKEYSKKYYQDNKEKRNEYDKKYRQDNKEKIRKRDNERYNNDPIFRLIQNTRSRVWHALKAQNTSKNQRTMEYVNCSVAHLYYHIEQQFKDGMNWDNSGKNCYGNWYYGRGWEIDHRRPCDSFDLNDEEQKYMCFHWTNLQPMWGQENNEKSNDYDPETFQYKWINREIGWVGIPSYLMKK